MNDHVTLELERISTELKRVIEGISDVLSRLREEEKNSKLLVEAEETRGVPIQPEVVLTGSSPRPLIVSDWQDPDPIKALISCACGHLATAHESSGGCKVRICECRSFNDRRNNA